MVMVVKKREQSTKQSLSVRNPPEAQTFKKLPSHSPKQPQQFSMEVLGFGTPPIERAPISLRPLSLFSQRENVE